MKEEKSEGPLRLGLVATDPLRILGLQTIFSKAGAKGGTVEIVPLSVPGALDASGVSLILIDAACTEHIFELVATFRRVRPHLRLIVLGLEEDHDYIQRIIGAGEGISGALGEGERGSAGDRDCRRWVGVGSEKGAGEVAGSVGGGGADQGGQRAEVHRTRGAGAAVAGGGTSES